MTEKIWVIGHKGLLGQAMVKAALRAGHEVIGSGSEVDICNGPDLWEFAEAHEYTRIVNCSGYTQVDLAERESALAFTVNSDAIGNFGGLKNSASLQHFSTDYVFNGATNKPYQEDAVPAPLNVYGKSKRRGEEVMKDWEAQIIRTSWLFGPGRKNFVTVMLEKMAESAPIHVVSDQVGSPTYAPDLATAALEIAPLHVEGHPCEIFHVTNAGRASWYEFAVEIRLFALELELPVRNKLLLPCSTFEYPRPAPRPRFSVLDCHKAYEALGAPLRPWQVALREYMTGLSAG